MAQSNEVQIKMQKEFEITNDEVREESKIEIEELITPRVEHCTGCGVKLQTENKRQAGYIDTKLLKRDKELEHMLRDDPIETDLN